jgi:hypothetical protein
MSSEPRPWWQFSLWELIIFTMVVAAVAAMIKGIGWGVLCMVFHPLMVLVYIAIFIDRRLRHRLKHQRQERELSEAAKRSREP